MKVMYQNFIISMSIFLSPAGHLLFTEHLCMNAFSNGTAYSYTSVFYDVQLVSLIAAHPSYTFVARISL